MKNSGIPWIGEIPDNWDVFQTSTLFHEHKQKNAGLTENNLLSLSYGAIKRKDINSAEGLLPASFETYNIVSDGDIIFRLTDLQNDKRSLRTGLCKERGIITSAYQALRPNMTVDSRYFHYLYHSYDVCKVFYGMGDGVRQGAGYEDLRKLLVLSPSFNEQKAIADLLDKKCSEIDEMISLQEKIIEELKAYKQSKVKELFDGYLEKEPYSTVKIGGLATLVTKQTGFDYSNTISLALVGDSSENTLPYLQTKNFKDGYWNYNTDYYLPKEVAARFPKLVLNKRSLLFSIVGASIGNVAVFPATTTVFLGGAICKVDLADESNYEYIKNYMLSYYGQEQISSKITASAQGTITVQNVRDFKIPMFEDHRVREKIISEVNTLSETISSLIKVRQDKVESLKEYKKSIIYEYVTGKKIVNA